MFSPDAQLFDADGQPIAIPKDRVVPPELAPPGLPIRRIAIPAPIDAPRTPGADIAASRRAAPGGRWAGILASAVLCGLYARGGAAWALGFVALVPWLRTLDAQRDARAHAARRLGDVGRVHGGGVRVVRQSRSAPTRRSARRPGSRCCSSPRRCSSRSSSPSPSCAASPPAATAACCARLAGRRGLGRDGMARAAAARRHARRRAPSRRACCARPPISAAPRA